MSVPRRIERKEEECKEEKVEEEDDLNVCPCREDLLPWASPETRKKNARSRWYS